MKKFISAILLSVISLVVFTSCGGKGRIITKNRTPIKANGGGTCYVFNIDAASKYIVNSHSNLISVYNFKGTSKDEIHFTDVYVDKDTYNGTVKVSKATGFNGIGGDYIPSGTTLKINDNNLYINCGSRSSGNKKSSKKVYLNNATVKLNSVGQDQNTNGTASFSFDLK